MYNMYHIFWCIFEFKFPKLLIYLILYEFIFTKKHKFIKT
jgi:hypothetical protein